tara:strand:+ start:681 stop:1022 length:342 start_codon:yes stop_codon:yes gene_type:complete
MLFKRSDADHKTYSGACSVREYNLPSEDFSFATAVINGCFPENGRVSNTKCDEIYFVISGSAVIHSDKGDFEICEGDVYFFKKGEKYWVEGSNLSLALVNTPKWFPEQHKIVE